jgi:O-antigen ligase
VALRLDAARFASALTLAATAALLGLLAGIRPELAIVAAIGVGFGLVVLADLAAGVALFTALTFFELLPGIAGPALSFTKLAGLALAISWLAILTTRHETASLDFFRGHPAIGAVLASLIAWVALSVVWAESPTSAVEFLYRFILNAILFLIVFTAIRTREDAIAVFAAFVIGATAAVAYGFLLADVDPVPYGQAARLTGGETQNANELASTLVAALVLCGGLLAVSPRSPILRGAIICAAAVAGIGILLTVSRGGMVALGASLLAAVIFGGRWRMKAAVTGSVIAAVVIVYFAFLAPSEARDRITKTEGGTGRTDIWKVGWRMVEAEPLHGVGAGNFPVTSIHYLIAPGPLLEDQFIVDTPKVAHNVYLGVLAELGAVGLSLLLVLVGSLVWTGLQAAREFGRRGDVRMELLARAHLAAIAGFLASIFFASDELKKQLWILLSMAPAMLTIATLNEGRDRAKDES